jgi:hypothetical protein
MPDLVICSRCRRHIRRSEQACPFCNETLAEAARSGRALPLPPPGVSRSAIVAFAAASLGAVACGGQALVHESGNTSGTGGLGGLGPMYGAPVWSGGAPNDNTGGFGNVALPYGIPPMRTGGAPNTDTGGFGNVAPPYGIAPFWTGGAPNGGFGGVAPVDAATPQDASSTSSGGESAEAGDSSDARTPKK